MRPIHTMVLWLLVAYFAVIICIHMGTAIWGTLGVFRPGDPGVTETTLPREPTQSLIENFRKQHFSLWISIILGNMALVVIIPWMTRGQVHPQVGCDDTSSQHGAATDRSPR